MCSIKVFALACQRFGSLYIRDFIWKLQMYQTSLRDSAAALSVVYYCSLKWPVFIIKHLKVWPFTIFFPTFTGVLTPTLWATAMRYIVLMFNTRMSIFQFEMKEKTKALHQKVTKTATLTMPKCKVVNIFVPISEKLLHSKKTHLKVKLILVAFLNEFCCLYSILLKKKIFLKYRK